MSVVTHRNTRGGGSIAAGTEMCCRTDLSVAATRGRLREQWECWGFCVGTEDRLRNTRRKKVARKLRNERSLISIVQGLQHTDCYGDWGVKQ